MIWLPPLGGAVHVTVTALFPGEAETFVGACGVAWSDDSNTTVAINHTVFAPVTALAAGVDPRATGWSSASISMLAVGETLARWVKPDPAARVSPKPESA